eukprot:1989504-Heterocapsa_arctica.AAC.1
MSRSTHEHTAVAYQREREDNYSTFGEEKGQDKNNGRDIYHSADDVQREDGRYCVQSLLKMHSKGGHREKKGSDAG